EDDLLELDTVADDERQVLSELLPQDYPTPLNVAQRQRNYLLRNLVQIQRLECKFLLAEQGTQSRDHVRGAIAIPNDPPRGFACALDIWRIAIQHPTTSTGVGDDAG